MAEVTIDNNSNLDYEQGLRCLVAVSGSVLYFFFAKLVTAAVLYRKSTDSGATWGSPVTIAGDVNSAYDVWFDKWTPGDSGALIHIVIADATSDDVVYYSLDTATDTLSGATVVFAGATFSAGIWTALIVSITKSKGGNLYVAFNGDGGTETGFYRSTNGGSTWASRTDLNESAADYFLLFPANLADTQDIWAVFWDTSANEISLKTYDDSLNSWAETSIATSMVDQTSYIQMSGVVRASDGHLILVAWNSIDVATADLQCWDINGAGSITAKTDVVTNSDDCAQCALSINQNNDDLYCAYIGKSDGTETWNLSVHIYYKKSTDGGATWGAETVVSTTIDDHRGVWADLGGTASLFLPVWYNDDLLDFITDSAKGVAFGALVETLSVAGTITSAGAILREVRIIRTGAGTPTGALVRKVNVSQAGGVTPAGSLVRQVAHALAGAVASSGALAAVRIVSLAVAGALASAGAVVFRVDKAVAGAVTPAGALVRVVSHNLAGTATSTGALVRQVALSTAGTVASAGSLVRLVAHVLAGSAASAGSVTKVVVLPALAGTITSIGSFSRALVKVFAGSVASSGALVRRVDHVLGGAITPAGTLVRLVNKVLAGALTLAGALLRWKWQPIFLSAEYDLTHDLDAEYDLTLDLAAEADLTLDLDAESDLTLDLLAEYDLTEDLEAIHG